MKKTFLIIAVLFLFLMSGCANTAPSFVPGNYATENCDPIMKGKNGYYFTSSKNLIMYYDKNTGKSIPLCCKPECDHANPYCIANSFSVSAFNTVMYENKLYVSAINFDVENKSTDYILQCVDAQGTERTNVAKYLSLKTDDNNFSCHNEMIMHKGKAILTHSIRRYEGQSGNVSFLFAVDISSGKADKYEIEMYDDRVGANGIENLCACGDWVYYNLCNIDADASYIEYKYDTYRYNLSTQKTERLPIPNTITDYTVTDDIVYYLSVEDRGLYLYSYDIESGVTHRLTDSPLETRFVSKFPEKAPDIMTDNNYLYIAAYGRYGGADTKCSSENGFYICNLDGKVLAEFGLPKNAFSDKYLPVYNDYLFNVVGGIVYIKCVDAVYGCPVEKIISKSFSFEKMYSFNVPMIQE